MEQGIIEYKHEVHPRTEFVMERPGYFYLAKGETNEARYKDAVEWEEYHGGTIFWEQCMDGTKIYRVFPKNAFRDSVGVVYSMESD